MKGGVEQKGRTERSNVLGTRDQWGRNSAGDGVEASRESSAVVRAKTRDNVKQRSGRRTVVGSGRSVRQREAHVENFCNGNGGWVQRSRARTSRMDSLWIKIRIANIFMVKLELVLTSWKSKIDKIQRNA